MALKEKAQVFAIKKALEYMDKDPAVNIPKLVDWMFIARAVWQRNTATI